MSVIQSIRDKGAWIIFGIIALALIAFILQDGVGRGRGSAFSAASVVGKVNGDKVLRGDFEEKLQLQERMYAGQGATREQLVASVWNQEVEQLILQQQYDKLGLQVTPKELGDILYGPNSPLRQEFTDPQTGEFMVNNAKQAIAQLKKSTNADQLKAINAAYIEPAIMQALRSKYQNLLIQGTYIPKWMVNKLEADNNALASFSYVYVPYPMSDSSVKVSDDEINAYINKHSKDFKKPEETRNITYVTFSSAPSAADSAAVLNQVLSKKSGFEAATDPQEYLTKEGSEIPYYNSYFSKNRMQQPNKDTLMKIPVGQVYGPYLDAGSYVMAKMVSIKQWPDSAKVRHILIGTVNPQNNQVIREDSAAKKLADSIQLAVAKGANFDSLVVKYSDDGGSKGTGGVYDYFPQGKMVLEFNDFAFDKPVGSKGVVKTDFGYHYIEVLGQKNMSPAYKIAYYGKTITASGETISAASNAAAQFSASSKNAKEFNANAMKDNKPVMPGNEIKENDAMIVGLGANRQLVRWVFENKVGDISEPMEVGEQYVVAIISAVHKAGIMSAAEARPMVEPIIRNEKVAAKIIADKFKGNTLESYAAGAGTQVMRMDSLSFSAPFVVGIGNEPKVAGAVFNKTLLNKASEPFAGNTGVFAVRAESVGARASAMDAESFKQNLLQSARRVSFRAFEALRVAADIKDNRSKYY